MARMPRPAPARPRALHLALVCLACAFFASTFTTVARAESPRAAHVVGLFVDQPALLVGGDRAFVPALPDGAVTVCSYTSGACAPIRSPEGEQYFGAMNAATNCALANRQMLAHVTREVFRRFFREANVETLFDVSHNTCKPEPHEVDGRRRTLFVHRKGATRAFGPGHPSLPARYRAVGQPVVIGGSMGTGSYILAASPTSEARAFSSASHGAGRSMSRNAAFKRWHGRQLVDELAERGIIIRTRSMRGVAEEAPGAYKDVEVVAEATERAGLARRVALLRPMICIKG